VRSDRLREAENRSQFVASQQWFNKPVVLLSNSSGTFSLAFSAVDSLIVVGYQLQEDQDFYYSSKVMTGQASRSFVLDMSRAGCGF
jgi:hypothetical protein